MGSALIKPKYLNGYSAIRITHRWLKSFISTPITVAIIRWVCILVIPAVKLKLTVLQWLYNNRGLKVYRRQVSIRGLTDTKRDCRAMEVVLSVCRHTCKAERA
jgi:hypothetical protein